MTDNSRRSAVLRFTRLRLEFTACEPIYFLPGKAANSLRGALLGVLSNPGAFVFRARHLDGCSFAAGEAFHFDLHVFSGAGEQIVHAFETLAQAGLGPQRGKGELVCAISEPITLELFPAPGVKRIRVDFLTPTELKHQNQIAAHPEFPILFARVRHRIGTLMGVPIELRTGTDAIEMTRCEIQWRHVERRSTRTGQTHSIGGFVGCAEYGGDLGEFLPYLKAAQWTGIGRHVVWGNGEIAVTEL